ncbi:tetratricopeptide repeat-containing sensor histidine kinase [Deminuibacter soli]|uniref:histidine kinase n=1 Tax=Deminuibacter soli TaxID=2291815 RepID=A0A3E1NLP7_9BACT|nr:sensor histidine kinase [Deminuibacter soli]RFM28859.1 sensor histidine kinase [Deminuibacter soli]
MLRPLLLATGLLIANILAYGQGSAGSSPEIKQLLFRVQKSGQDTNRIKALLQMGDYYLQRPGAFIDDLDSAYACFSRAQQLSNTLHSGKWQNEAMALLGSYYYETGDPEHGKSCYMHIIDQYHKSGDKELEKLYWNKLIALTSGNNKAIVPDNIQHFEDTRLLFIPVPDKIRVLDTLKNIAYAHIKEGRLDAAEKELLQVLDQYKANGVKKLTDIYELLAEVSKLETDLHKELFYKIELIKNMELTGDTARADYYYSKLALTYADLGMYDQSIAWTWKALTRLKRNGRLEDFYGDLSLIIYDLVIQGKAAEALVLLKKTMLEVPPINLAQKVDLSEGFGNCYAALKQYAKAEQYYIAMMDMFKITGFNRTYYSTNYQMVTDFIHYNQIMGNFYVTTKQYEKAGFYFGKILSLPAGSVRPLTLSKIHGQQFKVDSAMHNYLAAIGHFELHKRIDDSLYNDTKGKQIEELQIKYETEKKDKELQLKEKNIALLTNNSLVQEVSLRKANLSRDIIVISALILLAVAFTGYRFKQKHNIQLRSQQTEINNKNQKLEYLLAEQQKLVAQKEWLVREIHHRVKNNLQIVISLLNVQSSYLDNASALQAIQDSRERMQAIAIIHQKLYQPDTGTMINLKSYIQELMISLRDSFTGAEKIYFHLLLDEINMDVSQAVPVGLILNEAITNAVKYAFPGSQKGTIAITAKRLNGQEILLRIKDNGRGLPENFNPKNSNSLGIQLMQLFSQQLDGQLHIAGNNGVEVTLVFGLQQSVEGTNAFRNIPINKATTMEV